jgi:hypothetical protein
MKVKPAPGRAVRDPQQKYRLLPEQGGEVPDNAFWQRRLRDGDVVLIEDQPADAPTQLPANQGGVR